MSAVTVISKTELARNTRQVVDQARRGQTVMVESYGQEQVAIVDATDYRLLRTVAAYGAALPHPAPLYDEDLAPRGVDEATVEQALTEGDIQTAWNLVVGAYLDGDISIGRAAELLHLHPIELTERLHRLGAPLRLGPLTVEEARAEADALRR